MTCTIRTEVFGPKYCTRARLIAITSAMIRNGFITYPEAIASLRSYEPPPSVAVLIGAILSTLLSNQMTTIFHDLWLGIKPRGRARYISVAAALTIHDYSPSAWLATITQHPAILCFRFHRWTEKCSSTNDGHKLSRGARLWLVALGLVAPVINLAVVVLTLEFEGEAHLSFQEAQFGGVSLGVSDKENVFGDELLGCREIGMQLRRLDTPLTSFHLCRQENFESSSYKFQESVQVNVFDTAVSVVVQTPKFLITTTVTLELLYEGTAYVVSPNLRKDEHKELFEQAMVLVRTECQEEPQRVSTVVHSKTSIKLVSTFHCNDPDAVRDGIASRVTNVLRAVDTKSTQIYEAATPGDFGEGKLSKLNRTLLDRQMNMNKLALLKRPKRFRLIWLSTLTVAVVILRVIVGCMTRNDVEIGVEKLFKDGVGGLPWDSVLQSPYWVRWDRQVEIGGPDGNLDNIQKDCFSDELT